jgi:hypothetical protein
VGLPLAGPGETDLAKGRKGTPQKDGLAWWLCGRAAALRRWASRRLRMGGESRVTQAIRRVQDRPGPELAGFKQRLEGGLTWANRAIRQTCAQDRFSDFRD